MTVLLTATLAGWRECSKPLDVLGFAFLTGQILFIMLGLCTEMYEVRSRRKVASIAVVVVFAGCFITWSILEHLYVIQTVRCNSFLFLYSKYVLVIGTDIILGLLTVVALVASWYGVFTKWVTMWCCVEVSNDDEVVGIEIDDDMLEAAITYIKPAKVI